MSTPITTLLDQRKLEFDKKLKKIESEELKLKKLEEELQRLQSRMAEESRPILEEFCQLRFENLNKLKECLNNPYFKKKEKNQIIHLMIELAVGLENSGDSRAQDFLEDLIPSGPEEEEQEERDQDEFYSHEFMVSPPAEKHPEGKLEIKTLFRQLAKAFHPDRETQEHLKEEKTSLMKKITAAYENQDLYSLLKLEKEHLGPREFTEDKIMLYIKHINDRLKELKAFEARLKKHGMLSTVYQYIYSKKATTQERNVRNELSKIEEEVEKERELQSIIWDRTSLRNFLKS